MLKASAVVFPCLLILFFSGCSPLPKECADSWEKIEKLGLEIKLTEEQMKTQKKHFEENLKNMSKEDAIKTCETQSDILGLVGSL